MQHDTAPSSLDGVAGIRAQRREVEALLAYTHARDEESRALAWWTLLRARQVRLAAMRPAESARLPPLPAPPPGALNRLQALRLRLGWLSLAKARPDSRLARRIG
ncbi:hypothetical protein ACLF3G_00025 [Falsiroseomonas sp. HC035]|uniref:hypothetical protein n=1 Tax=Falsiroseomonas sp. HC035 TaxID=3390999 RepID=UPI003D31E007